MEEHREIVGVKKGTRGASGGGKKKGHGVGKGRGDDEITCKKDNASRLGERKH